MKQGDWMASIDLEVVYFHVPSRPSHRIYLRFAFQGRCFQWLVLPFGLNSAPLVWTKVFTSSDRLASQNGDIPLSLHSRPVYKGRSVGRLNKIISHLSRRSSLSRVHSQGQKGVGINSSSDLIYVGGRFRTDRGVVAYQRTVILHSRFG